MVTSLAFALTRNRSSIVVIGGMVQFLCFPPPGPMRPARHLMSDRCQLRRFQRPETCRSVLLRGGLHAVRLRLRRSGLLTRTRVVVVPDVPRRVRCGTQLFFDGGENDQ